MTRLLEGVQLALHADGPAGAVCDALLSGLGASVRRGDEGPAGILVGEIREWPGVAGGAVEVASGYAAATAALVATWTGRSVRVDRDAVASWVLTPGALAARWPRPARPRPVAEGAVCAELGAPGDEELFARLLTTLDDATRSDPVALAAAAQEWRLPVAPFASRPGAPSGDRPVVRVGEVRKSAAGLARPGGAAGPLAGIVVCDLTAMWGGPLATRMLGMLGAEVIKVDTEARPDGLRFWGAATADSPSALYRALNTGKRIIDLDLRTGEGLAGLHQLLDQADVVVDSFSRRVMPGFGLSAEEIAERWPTLAVAGLRAYPPGERGGWVAYGSGVHAAAGFGDLGDSGVDRTARFVPPAISYPDPLGGFLLCAAIVAQLLARERIGRLAPVEVSLWEAVDPLWNFAQPARLTEPLGPDDRERLRRRLVPPFESLPAGYRAVAA